MAGLLASLAGTMGQVRKEAAHSGRMSAGGQARHPHYLDVFIEKHYLYQYLFLPLSRKNILYLDEFHTT